MIMEEHLFNVKKLIKSQIHSVYFVGDFLEGTLDRTKYQLVITI